MKEYADLVCKFTEGLVFVRPLTDQYGSLQGIVIFQWKTKMQCNKTKDNPKEK